MERKHLQTVLCQICQQRKRPDEALPAELVRPSLVRTIHKEHPEFSSGGYICLEDLNRFRAQHVEDVLEEDRGELSQLESDIVRSMQEHELLSKDINIEFDRQLTLGERLADRIAEFGGSWTFILIFFLVILVWMSINSVVFLWRPFDPYPFILLNLLLSCLAAVQAPVIMMSQNRQEDKDRLRSENDYRVNLKAEMEIRHLNEKMDHLLVNQWERLLEIQRIQMELMQEMVPKSKK